MVMTPPYGGMVVLSGDGFISFIGEDRGVKYVMVPKTLKVQLETIGFTPLYWNMVGTPFELDVTSSNPYVWTNTYNQAVMLMAAENAPTRYELSKDGGNTYIATSLNGTAPLCVWNGDVVAIYWDEESIPIIRIYPAYR